MVLKLERHREGRAHQLVEVGELVCGQPVLHLRVEAIDETALFPLISTDLLGSVLCKVIEHLHVLHHGSASLLEVLKLLPLDLHEAARDVERAEGLAELRPRHSVVGRVHGQEVGPPRARQALKLMGSKEHLFVILASEERKLLLDHPEPVIGIQSILSLRENRRLSPQKSEKSSRRLAPPPP